VVPADGRQHLAQRLERLQDVLADHRVQLHLLVLSAVSTPPFLRMRSSMPILPTSCSTPAIQMRCWNSSTGRGLAMVRLKAATRSEWPRV
jgi:hypothetical protein